MELKKETRKNAEIEKEEGTSPRPLRRRQPRANEDRRPPASLQGRTTATLRRRPHDPVLSLYQRADLQSGDPPSYPELLFCW
jgi:hypothetical protein